MQTKLLLMCCFQKITIFFLATLLSGSLLAQDETNAWRTLAMMKYERTDENSLSSQGQFIKLIEEMEGREIKLKGYIVPLSGKKAQSHFMFSAYPYNNCFFCGKAGPESVVEVYTKERQRIPFSEKAIEIKGIFKFTSRDPEAVMFTLENAYIVE